MSCDVAAAALMMFAAYTGPSDAHLRTLSIAAEATAPMARPALFDDIVGRAGKLKGEVDQFRSQVAAASAPVPMPNGDAFTADITQLSALDQQGSDWLKAHSPDGDLKCIMHGISQDLPTKLAAVQAAKTPKDEIAALKDMGYLLRDNVEVITSPPRPAA